MCFFVWYKYEGGGYQVWDPKRRVVVESKYLAFRSPPPTLNDSRPQPVDEDEPTVQPTPRHTTELPTLPAVSDAPAPILPTTASPEATHKYGPTTTPHPCITMRLPGCWMKRPAVEHRDESDEYDGSEDEATRPIHDVLYVPDCPVRLTVAPCSFSMRQRIVQSRFRPVYLAVADPGNVLEGPDADQWKEAMDREMEGLKSHDVHELVPRTNGTVCGPSNLFTGSTKMAGTRLVA